MRAARGILFGLLGLLVIAIAAVWIVPPLLDWTRYRARVADIASGMLGQKVTIEGEVGLVLLPAPALTASQVTLGNGTLSVAALRLHAALWPLLTGVIEPRDLVLQSPRLQLPWPLPNGRDLALPTAWPSGLAVRVEDGAARIGGLPATDLQAIAQVADSGALTVSGHGAIGGHDWTFEMRLTAAGGDGSSGVDLLLGGTGALASTRAHFTGQMGGQLGGQPGGQTGGFAAISGEATVSGDDLSALMPAPAAAFRAQGRLTAADGLVAADDLAVELAGAPARAAVALRLLPIQRLDLSLAIGRLDLQAWLLPLLHPPAASGASLPVGLDLSAEAAELGGATLRRLRCAFDLSPQAADLREASAILPGEATLTVTGRITRGPAAAFVGEGSLRTADLPATAGWVAKAVGFDTAITARLPRAASLVGRISATADQLSLASVSGTSDGAALAGALTARLGPHPALDVTARLARLDLDPWWPTGLPTWSALNRLAGASEIALEIRSPAATLRGLALHDLVLHAASAPGTLHLRRLTASLGGARLDASGAIDPAGALSAGQLDVAVDQAGGVADLAPPWLAAVLRRAVPLHLTVTAQGPPQAIAAHAELAVAGGQVSADPVIDPSSGSVRGPIRLTHPSAAGLLALLGWLPPGAESWLGAGGLAAQADIVLAPQHLTARQLDLRAGASQAGASLQADWQDSMPRVTGRIMAANLRLPWPMAADGVALPFGLLRGWEARLDVGADRIQVGALPPVSDVRARFDLAAGALAIGGFTAHLGGGALTAAATIDGAAAPPTVQANARLEGAMISGRLTGAAIDLLSGTASADLRVAAAGYSLAALRATEHGAVTLDVAHGTLLGFDLARLREALQRANDPGLTQTEVSDTALRGELGAALAGGRSDFDTLHAQATLSASGLELRAAGLTGPDGQADAAGEAGLGGAAIELLLALRPAIPSGPQLGLRLTGSPTTPTRTPELGGVLRWLSHM